MTDKKESNIDAKTLRKYRLTGTGIWLLLLIIVVPFWYSHPVNFQPDGSVVKDASPQAVVKKAYTISGKTVHSHYVKPVGTPQKTVQASANKVSGKAALSNAKPAVSNKRLAKEAKASSHSKPSWIIRLIAYKEKVDAENMYQRLKYDYEAYIKFFPESQYYSVRVGPYFSKDIALKDQKRLNSGLHIQSELVKITQSAKK